MMHESEQPGILGGGRLAADVDCESEHSSAPRTLKIGLICPRFEPSFFGMEYALPLLPGNKKFVSIGSALPLLAALVPDGHDVHIFDENVEDLDFDLIKTFDVVGLTGMIVQRARMDAILGILKGTGPVLCVGGPYVTVEQEFFAGKCDVVFVGEADTTWPAFIDDLARGKNTDARYAQREPTDMTALPCPRYDLVKAQHYLVGTVQFSRGCPFLCEFCDIIVMFGRRPRMKGIPQIIEELDALVEQGVRSVFFVDDNFIGNKLAAKDLLVALVAWQARQPRPMIFSTEASINLGDEADLLSLLNRSNFRSVFIGIESPRPESLRETRKTQNVRGDSNEAKIARIQEAGLVVQAGFIVGFDADDERIFDEQFDFIARTGIGAAFVSVLSPIPSTPLFDRLQREGRLRLDNELVWFEPKQMSRERLARGYHDLNNRIYDPDAFFDRVFGQAAQARLRRGRPSMSAAPRRRRLRGEVRAAAEGLGTASRLVWEVARNGHLRDLGPAYLRGWRRNRSLRQDRLPFTEFLALCARHWHAFRVARQGRTHWGCLIEAGGSGPDPRNGIRLADPADRTTDRSPVALAAVQGSSGA